MIHRFIDLLEEPIRLPDIPILAFDRSPTLTRTLWQIGNQATPYRMIQPIVSTSDASGPHLGDPEREPVNGDSVVYCRFNVSGTINRSVRLVDWADTTDTQLYADTSGGPALSLEPTWKPDGTKILFRAKGAGTELNLLKHMNADGTGVATIYTGGGRVSQPLYSSDGTLITWSEGESIMVANADGSSPAAAFTIVGGIVFGAAWKYGSNVLGFRYNVTAAFTSDEKWMQVNADGTGLTTLLTISRAAGYGPGDGDPGAIKWSWRLDDSAIATTVRQTADPDPDARLTLVDGTGSHLITPARYGASNAGSSDTRPVVLSGRDEGVERIYWLEQPSAPVSSVLPDGSDYRVDFDGSGTAGGSDFQGFRGDTVNV